SYDQQRVLKRQAKLFGYKTHAPFTSTVVEVNDIEVFRGEILIDQIRNSEAAVLHRTVQRLHLLYGDGDEINAESCVTCLPPAELNVWRPDTSSVKNSQTAP